MREGRDVTVVAYGAMVARSLAAAEPAERGHRLRGDRPPLAGAPRRRDARGVASAKTGRAVVVHEAPMTLGFGAEIVARIVEDAFDYLEAPVVRVTGWDTPYPPATLEEHYLPNVKRILRAVGPGHGY